MPETITKLSITPNVRYSRLFPVFMAAKPTKSVSAIYKTPSFVGDVLAQLSFPNLSRLI